MLKCQLHIHTAGDPEDHITHSPKDLIKFAAQLKYDVLAITCHNKLVFSKSLEKYAKKKNILLIPGIEISINKKHILILNADSGAEKIKSFDDLTSYKKSRPQSLIIAPHPFFPGSCTLKTDLIKHINLFDAIEHSFCYTITKNYNRPAIKIAEKYKKPLIATSDCHILKHLDLAYTEIDANKTIPSIFKAIKANKVNLIHVPLGHFKVAKILLQTFGTRIHKRIHK